MANIPSTEGQASTGSPPEVRRLDAIRHHRPWPGMHGSRRAAGQRDREAEGSQDQRGRPESGEHQGDDQQQAEAAQGEGQQEGAFRREPAGGEGDRNAQKTRPLDQRAGQRKMTQRRIKFVQDCGDDEGRDGGQGRTAVVNACREIIHVGAPLLNRILARPVCAGNLGSWVFT